MHLLGEELLERRFKKKGFNPVRIVHIKALHKKPFSLPL